MPRVTKQMVIDLQKEDIRRLRVMLTDERERRLVAEAELKGLTRAGSLNGLIESVTQMVAASAHVITDLRIAGRLTK
ncbi:MAG: hypothetical protein WC455_21375 [Dehalococcoidia bacterium]|jgi:hypothetical protein